MGRPTPARQASDTDAVSLHTTPDDYNYDDLPSYADSVATASTAAPERPLINPPTFYQHTAPQDDYAAPPATREPQWLTTVEAGSKRAAETTIRLDERLMDPYNLYSYIMDVVRMLPPSPMIKICGWHYETTHKGGKNEKKTQERVNDFDFKVSLQSLLRPALAQDFWEENVALNSSKTYRGTFRKIRAPGHTQGVQLSDEPVPDLKEWCDRYCSSPARLKVFRVRRDVQGFDNALLEGLITDLIRSTEYRGRIEIKFPVNDKYVDIYSPHFINRWRTSWVRFLFYFTFLWIITWPLLLLWTKWYTVYNVIWSFSVPEVNGNGRKYACVSERTWFNAQKEQIKNLALNRFCGDGDLQLGINDIHAARAPTRPDTGNANVNSAITFVQQGANIWNQVSRGQHQVSAGAWGYDC